MFLLKNQKQVFQKFFFPVLFSILTFVAAVVSTELDEGELRHTLYKIFAVVALGISIGFGIEFLQIPDSKRRVQARLLGLLFLVIQILVSWIVIDIRRFSFLYANLFLLSHLFVALCIWFSTQAKSLTLQERNQYFWNQNWRLFIGFQSTALVNAVLFIGLCLGLASLKLLFNYEVPERTYLYLFYALATIGGTFYLATFLLGDFQDDNESKILSTLVRYIFPLLQVLYFTILYIYLIKIVINWSLPRGYVGWMVSGLSVLICLSQLIIKPVQEKFSSSFLMQKIWRSSFALVIPLLVLMLVSLFRRIDEYGLTEKRYILLVLSVWMVYTAITHLKPTQAKIQSIPLSLFVVTLLTTTGPLNSYSISLWSQSRRLVNHLQSLKGELNKNQLIFKEPVSKVEQIRFVRTMKSICDTYGVTRLYEILGSKDIPVVLPSEEYNCYYQSGNNETSKKPFALLLATTKFEVLAIENLFYSYMNDAEVVHSNKSETFRFAANNRFSDSYIQAFGFEISKISINSFESNKLGQGQLIFQRTGEDQITWSPEKGSLKIIDLRRLMGKLSQVQTSYVFSDHPEDSEIEISNEFSQVKLKISRIEFSKDISNQQLSIAYLDFVAITSVSK